MLRFPTNRWWAFILALGVFLVFAFAVSAQLPTVARADGSSGTQIMSEPTPPGDSGDPDVPTGSGPTKGTGWTMNRGYTANTSPSLGVRPTGEGSTLQSAWTQRIRLVLLSLRGLFLGF